MSYRVGDKVMVKDNLYVGKAYFNDDMITRDVFTEIMVKNVGKEAEIIRIIGGKYMLDIDPYHSYTDEMLIPLNNVIISKPIHANQYALEAEKLIEHMLELVPEQLINHALDNGNKEMFKKLIEKYHDNEGEIV